MAQAHLIDSPQGTAYGAVEPQTPKAKTLEDIQSAPSAKELLSCQRIRRVLIAGFFLSFLCVAWETVFVLFAYTPARLGGLQRSVSRQQYCHHLHTRKLMTIYMLHASLQPSEIGFFLSTLGVLGIFLSLVAFPTLQHRFDTLPLYRACMACWPVIFVLFSATSIFARLALRRHDTGGDEDPSVSAFIWIGVSVILLIGRVAAMGFALSTFLCVCLAKSPGGRVGLTAPFFSSL